MADAGLGGGPHGPAADPLVGSAAHASPDGARAAAPAGDAPAPAPASTWAPLRIAAFRSLWIAQLVSNVGTWMQSVGAQWLVVHGPDAAVLTALAQAASLLPVLLVSLPAGVLADVLDRRRLLVATEATAVLVVAVLALLTALGDTTPALLISLTFALGVTTALANPAWQAIQPELVPRRMLASAAALGSMNVNIARAIGPALAGLVIALWAPAAVFAINAASTAVVVVVLARWRRPAAEGREPERITPALRSGARYVANAPIVRRILLRSALFVVPASALWALLAVVASRRLGLGSGGYGVLLGALGLGAVVGALVLGRVRARIPTDPRLVVFTLVYTLGVLGAALATSTALLVVLLLAAGVGWLVMLSTFNTALQLMLPAWVRARALSAYLVVFMGGQGVGAIVWGFVGQWIGIAQALLVAAGLLVLGAATVAVWPIGRDVGQLDRSVAAAWPEPETDVEPDPDAGPVLVEVTYVVPDRVDEFLAAARRLGVSRRRTGATSWAIYRDAADATVFVEVFTVPTWSEHLRQHHERLTGFDRELSDTLVGLSADGASRTRHLVAPD